MVILSSILYWNYRLEINEDSFLEGDKGIMVDLPIPSLENEHLFHAVCYQDNYESLDLLMKYLKEFQTKVYSSN